MGFTALLYYASMTGLVAGAAFGAYYVYNPKKAKAVAFSALWASIRAYAAVGHYTDIVIEVLLDQEDEEDGDQATPEGEASKEPQSHMLLFYNDEKGVTYSTDDFRQENLANITENPSLLIFREKRGDKMSYRRLMSLDDLKDCKFVDVKDKQFLQIELEEDGVTREIHKHMGGFYMPGNKILDTPFLSWYMDFWYDHELKPNYTLQIFDKDVNMITLGPGDSVVITEEGYKTSSAE